MTTDNKTRRPKISIALLPGQVTFRWSVGALCTICLAGPSALKAQEEKLPDAATILDKYVQVTGGKVAYEKLQNKVSKGTCDFVSLGMKASLTSYAAAPNKYYVVLESESMGRMEEGTTDGVAWEIMAMTGPRVKEGTERADALRNAVFDAPLHWRKLYNKAECAGIETIADKPCYKIILTPAEGNPQTQYYDRESNLLIGTSFALDHPMGRLDVQMRMSDYRPVDGALIAHKIKMSYAGQEQIITLAKIEHNVAISADRFALPEEIRALAAKRERTHEQGE